MLMAAWDRYPGRIELACSRVVWTDGRDHPMNTARRRPWVSSADLEAARSAGAVPVRSSSFVSVLVSADAVRENGLPIADYFLWNDDFEYSCRLLRNGVGLRVPASVVEHRTAHFGAADVDPGHRFYFEVRNKCWMLTRSRSLSPGERVLYTGASLRRWTRTLLRSQRRGVLVRAGARGLRDGVLRAPRRTERLLAEVGSRGVTAG
jgi:GT2 family glycosyltransferase